MVPSMSNTTAVGSVGLPNLRFLAGGALVRAPLAVPQHQIVSHSSLLAWSSINKSVMRVFRESVSKPTDPASPCEKAGLCCADEVAKVPPD